MFSAQWQEYIILKSPAESNICAAIQTFFAEIGDTEMKDFLLSISYQVEHVLQTSQALLVLEELGKHFELSDLKKGICEDLKMFNCTNLNANQCSPAPYKSGVSFAFLQGVFMQWAYRRYHNAKALLHILNQNAFFIDKPSLPERFNLLLNSHKISMMHGTDIYSQWHYLNGMFMKDKGVEKILITNGKVLGMTKDVCTKPENCKEIEDFFHSIDQASLERLKQLIDQPKMHSDNREDFTLVPLCSFGTDLLKKCDLFHRSKMTFQDNTCYTYDEGQNAEPFAPNGLNFLLDLNHMPSEQEMSLKVFFHQHGTIPDVLRLESASLKVTGTGNILIGLDIRTTEVTQNFAKMSFEKRQCLIPEEMENYTRIECLVKQVHDYATSKCQCLPFLMGGLVVNQSNNVECSVCFRTAIKKAKPFLNESLCPSLCSESQFNPLLSRQHWNDPTKYGNELITWLTNNPLGLYLDKISDSTTQYPYDKQSYLRRLSKGFSLVQIFFGTPQKTVITKDAKVTETDMVSNIGGTIGIFLGLSTISVLDKIIDWLATFYATKIDKIKNKREL